jgi:hypothetical protein
MRPRPLPRASQAPALRLVGAFRLVGALWLTGTFWLAAAALLAGCGTASSVNGIASKTPEQIVAAARAAADGAATVHVSGLVLDEGMRLSLNMELVAGKGGQGRIVEGPLDFRLIDVDRFLYIKGSPAFYRHIGGEAAVRVLDGRWLKTRARGSFTSLASLTNLGKLVDTALTSHGTLARNGTTTVDGQRAVAVGDASNGGTLYVATGGSPYPIEILKHGGSGGRIVFDRWNKPVTLAVPADAINISQLQSGR